MSAKQLRCPKCSSVVTIPENVPGGNTLKCPRCTALFRTPTGQTSPPAKPALVKPAGAVPQPVVAIKPAGQAPKPQVANKSINPGSAKPSHQVPFTPQLLSVPPATNQRNPRSKQPNKKLPLIIGAGVGGGLLLSVLLVLLLNTGGNTPVVENKPNAPQNDTPQPKDNNAPRPNLMPVKNEGKIDLLGGVDPFTNQQPITGKPRLVLNPGGHVSVVKKVLFTPDGGKLITASLDKTVRVWNVATGETEKVFRMPIGPGHEGSINTIALSRDGKKLAVAGVPLGNGTLGDPIYLISLASGQVEKVLLGHKNNITGVDFSPDGKRLASCSMDNHCLIHEIETGRIIGNLNGHTSSLRRIYYSPDGQFLATASKDETVRIWDANTNQTVAILKSVAGPILSHFWSPDGNTLATGTAIGTIQLWTRTGQLIKNFPVTHPEKTLLISLRFAKDGNEILYTGIDDRGGKAGIFNLKTEQRRVTFPHHNNTVHDAHISPNGELAATTGGNDHETFIWRVNDASIVHKLVGKGQAIWAVGWSQDRNTIAWGTTNTPSAPASVERTFDVTTFQFGSRPEKKDFLPAPVTNSAGFALEKKDANLIQIVRNGQPVSVFKSPFAGDRILGYCVLPSDRGVIGTGFGLFLLDLNTGKPIRHFQGHADMVTCLYPSPDGRHFLTGSGDQTISMWSTERNEPIMSFFFAGQDWIAWTPEGYYSCSANGERLMGWQINNGFERLGTFYEAVRFRQSLYRPEVIKHLVKTGDLAQAIAQAGQQQNQPAAQAVNVADVLPPQVKIMTPASDRGAVQLKDGKLEVVAAAKSVGNHPVTAMRLIVDGRPYRGEESIFQFANPQLGVRSASWNLELTPGQHFIQVQAESAVSKAVSDPLQVVCEGSTQELPNLYVLAIGINEYQGKMRLNFATQDAVALAEMLQSKTKGVFGRVEVQLLKDQSATKLNIVKGLLWMNSKMTANDVGIFFFGGHGLQDPWGNFHLVPVDVKLNNPGSTCIPGNAVKKALANMPGKLIAMFDACHSGAAAGGSGAVARPDDLMRDLVTEECGVIVMCSSLGSEYSMESPLTQHGFFTLGLLEGLEGKADFDNDQTIFIHEMDRYACLRVKQLSQGMQNPITARPPSIPSFALTKAN